MVGLEVPVSGARSVTGLNLSEAADMGGRQMRQDKDRPAHTHTPTLPASLSGTFLQTLPDLVTPLKRHSLFPRSCPPTRSAPSETNMTVEAT